MKESERQWFCMDRASALIHAVDADTSQPFLTTDKIDDLKVLKSLKAKGIFSLRGDLVKMGEKQIADDIIFKKAFRLLK